MIALISLSPNQMTWEEWSKPQTQSGEAVVAVKVIGVFGNSEYSTDKLLK